MNDLVDLIKLTRRYLEDNFEPDEWLSTDAEHVAFFRGLAKKPSAAEKLKPRALPPPPQVKTITKKAPPPRELPIEKAESDTGKEAAPPEPIAVKKSEKTSPVSLLSQLETLRKVCPSLGIIEEIPGPAGPKKVAILSDSSPFWEKVADALESRNVETSLIDLSDFERFESEASNFDLALVPRTLKKTITALPVIATEETHLYQTDVVLKRVLWKSLCAHLNI